MSTRPTTALVRSMQDRLKNEAHDRGRPFAELLELFAVERFLHRLGRSSHRDTFVLKGALLLRTWLGEHTRPTRDIDLLAPTDLDAEGLLQALRDILAHGVEDDGIDFEPETIVVRPIRVESPVLGMRAKFNAHHGPTRLRYQVDVGFGDATFPPTVEIEPGGLLGLPMASVRAYTPYTTVAEKLEAMVVLGASNSRTKDYFDLYQLPQVLEFDGPTLVESIRQTFARRSRSIPEEPLEGLAEAFASSQLNASRWQGFIAKNRLDVSGVELSEVLPSIRAFAQPALDAARDTRPFPYLWREAGPWRSP